MVKLATYSIAILLYMGLMGIAAQGQSPSVPIVKPGLNSIAVRSSPAYAEVVLREVELKAELESLLAEYTDDFPKVKEGRQAIEFLGREKARLLTVAEKDAGKLTLALGKIQVAKIAAELELWRLQQSLADGHPEVKRAKKKVEVYESAIKEILG